jgi:hypothetical protein
MNDVLDNICFPLDNDNKFYWSEALLRKILPATWFFKQGIPYTRRELNDLLATSKPFISQPF